MKLEVFSVRTRQNVEKGSSENNNVNSQHKHISVSKKKKEIQQHSDSTRLQQRPKHRGNKMFVWNSVGKKGTEMPSGLK